MMFGGRPSLSGRHGGGRRPQVGWGREGGVRLDDTPMLRHRRGSMSELMDGIGGLGLGGSGGSGGRSPLIGRSSLGSRGSSLFGGRSPLDDDLLGVLGGRRGSLLGGGMGMGMGIGGLGSRDGLLSPRAGLLGGGLLGGGSRAGSSRASSIYDLYALDRLRMPYGPLGPRLSNYRQPYFEDHYSEIDPEDLLLMEEMDRRGHGFWYDDRYDDRVL
jgi:hypothetical protein